MGTYFHNLSQSRETRKKLNNLNKQGKPRKRVELDFNLAINFLQIPNLWRSFPNLLLDPRLCPMLCGCAGNWLCLRPGKWKHFRSVCLLTHAKSHSSPSLCPGAINFDFLASSAKCFYSLKLITFDDDLVGLFIKMTSRNLSIRLECNDSYFLHNFSCFRILLATEFCLSHAMNGREKSVRRR